MAYSYNVYDDVDVGRIPRATDAPNVRSIRLKPVREGRPDPAPELHGPLGRWTASWAIAASPEYPAHCSRLNIGRFFSLNREGPGVKTVVLRVPFSTLTALSTVAERFGHVNKVDYFHRDGICDIHLRYVPRGAACNACCV